MLPVGRPRLLPRRQEEPAADRVQYGALTDPKGRPVAVRVLAGNTADPTAFTDIVAQIHDTFGLQRLVLVGDRA